MRITRRKSWLAVSATAALLLPLALTSAPALADPTGPTVVYSEGATWETGYSAQFTINNPGPAALDDWTVKFTLPSGASVGSLWNAVLTESGGAYTMTPPSWGGSVPAGGSYSIGFNGVGGSGGTAPLTCTINDAPCDGTPGAPDTEAPTVPGSPASSAQTSSSITLTWTASTDNRGVSGYEVLDADDQIVRNVVGDATTATVGGLDADTEYVFRVRAYDAAGNKSGLSAPVTARTAKNGGGGAPTPTVDGRRVGYFTQWGVYARDFLVKDLVDNGTAPKLTHINYAFANINTNGECFIVNQLGQGDAWADYGRSYTDAQSVDGVGDVWSQDLRGNFNQLRELKEKYPDLKVNISIGGWTWSKNFSDAVLTPASRERLVDSCIDLYLRGNLPVFDDAGGPGSAYGVFDGIDLDWEWPASEGYEENTFRPQDRENFTALVALFRQKLDALGAETGREFELTSFMPADPEKVQLGYEVPQLMQNFDFITLQGYDYHGGWENNTNHQSNITEVPGDPGPRAFSSQIALDAWVSRGADPADIVFGVPFYGRGWTGVPAGPNGDGLFQTATGPAPGPYEAGIDDYKNLKNLTGYTLHRDAGTAWLYNGSTFWQFDDAVSMTEKVDWAQSQGLGGIMIWSLDGDDSNGTLITAIDSALRN